MTAPFVAFVAGIAVEALLALAVALIVAGLWRYRIDRAWTLLGERGEWASYTPAIGSDELETAHSAL